MSSKDIALLQDGRMLDLAKSEEKDSSSKKLVNRVDELEVNKSM